MSTFAAHGDRIAHLRRARNWTQEQLADSAGCSDRTVRNAEAGRAMSSQTLIDLAHALSIELCEIVSPKEYRRIVQPNREAVERVIRWVVEKDVESILGEVTDDIELWYSGPEELPYSGVYRGKHEMRRFFAELLRGIDWVGLPVVESWIATHDHVVVHGHDEVRFFDMEETMVSNWCISFCFRDGLIYEIRHYQDHSTTLRLLGITQENRDVNRASNGRS